MEKWKKRMIEIKCSIKDKKHVFTQDKKISTFGDDIKNGDITMDKASHEKNKLVQMIILKLLRKCIKI